jgi:tetratricopeptide (TPR) repeat protein
MLVAVALVAVVGLYVLTQLSSSEPTEAPPVQSVAPGIGAAPAGPMPSAPAAPVSLPDSLAARLAVLEDTDTAQSWAEGGRLLFEAALLASDEGTRAAFAEQAVDAFDRSLALTDDPDVRTNLAAAALYDPRNPMRAVEELQSVLGADPDHVEANFNMGLMRMRIGRMEQAAESFRRVIAMTTPEEPVHQEAQRALASVEQSLAQPGG